MTDYIIMVVYRERRQRICKSWAEVPQLESIKPGASDAIGQRDSSFFLIVAVLFSPIFSKQLKYGWFIVFQVNNKMIQLYYIYICNSFFKIHFYIQYWVSVNLILPYLYPPFPLGNCNFTVSVSLFMFCKISSFISFCFRFHIQVICDSFLCLTCFT